VNPQRHGFPSAFRGERLSLALGGFPAGCEAGLKAALQWWPEEGLASEQASLARDGKGDEAEMEKGMKKTGEGNKIQRARADRLGVPGARQDQCLSLSFIQTSAVHRPGASPMCVAVFFP